MFLKTPPTIPKLNLGLYPVDLTVTNPGLNKRLILDREILAIFITRIYDLSLPYATSIFGNVPKHLPSLLMYKYVFSKFVEPDNVSTPEQLYSYTPTAYPPPFNYSLVVPKRDYLLQNNNEPLLEPLYRLVVKKGDLFVKLKTTTPISTTLIIPSPLDQGMLMDGCYIMAMIKLRNILLTDIKLLEPQNGISYKVTANSTTGTYKFSKEAKRLFSALTNEKLYTSKTTKIKNPIVDLKGKLVESTIEENKRALVRFFDPDLTAIGIVENGNFFDTVGYRDVIQTIWEKENNLLGKIVNRLTDDRLQEVLDMIFKIKTEIVNGYALSFFKLLGGNVTSINFTNAVIGDGSETEGLLNYQPFKNATDLKKNAYPGVSLFSYDYQVGKRNSSSSEEVLPMRHQTLDIDFSSKDIAKNKVIHFNLFALNASTANNHDDFYLVIKATADKKDAATLFVLQDVMYAIGVGPGRPTVWTDPVFGTIGYYVFDSNDLVITNKSITKVQLFYSDRDNFVIDLVNSTPALPLPLTTFKSDHGTGIPELILTVNYFSDIKTRDFQLELDAATLFNDDRFEVTSAIKQSEFWSKDPSKSLERKNALDLISFIQEKPVKTISTDLFGNGVGMLRVPFKYDPTQAYPPGAYVLYNNELYIATGPINANINPDSTGSNWQPSSFNATITYDYVNSLIPDFIKVIEASDGTISLRRLKKTPASNTYDENDWELIAKFWSPTSAYIIGSNVIKEDVLYEAIVANNGSFNSKHWKKKSRVETDPRYLPFSKRDAGVTLGSGEAKDTPLKAEDDGSTPSNLKQYLYGKLRYSFADFKVDATTIKIIINSYASPLRSRLDHRYKKTDTPNDFNPAAGTPAGTLNSNRMDFIDINSIAGLNGFSNTAFKFGTNLPYYNQVLSALRSMGILDAIICRLVTISGENPTLLIPNSARPVRSLLEPLLSSSTKVSTTNTYDGSGEVDSTPRKEIKYTDTLPNFGYKELKWYISNAEQGTTYDSCAD